MEPADLKVFSRRMCLISKRSE